MHIYNLMKGHNIKIPQQKPNVSCTASHLPRFFVAANILENLLASLRGFTVKLLSCSTDILEAYSLVSEMQTNLSLCRETIDEEFHNLFQDITDENRQ